jgi:cytochrome c oxidase subunit 2
MHIDRYESTFLRLSGVMLVVFAGAILISVFGLGVQLPTQVDQVAPADVSTEPGFDNPGVREVYPGHYEAYIVAQTWQFTPARIDIPAGSEVTFFITSKDVIHGFKVFDTNINIMIIPGQVSEVTHTFNEPGEFQFYCHEYCGSAHHTMTGVINITGGE